MTYLVEAATSGKPPERFICLALRRQLEAIRRVAFATNETGETAGTKVFFTAVVTRVNAALRLAQKATIVMGISVCRRQHHTIVIRYREGKSKVTRSFRSSLYQQSQRAQTLSEAEETGRMEVLVDRMTPRAGRAVRVRRSGQSVEGPHKRSFYLRTVRRK